jgi:hypothetical protein
MTIVTQLICGIFAGSQMMTDIKERTSGLNKGFGLRRNISFHMKWLLLLAALCTYIDLYLYDLQ